MNKQYLDFQEYILDYDKKKRNNFVRDDLAGFLSKAAEKKGLNITSEKMSKSIMRTNILFEDNIIGFLNGVRPSSTNKEAIKFIKNIDDIKKFISSFGITLSENLNLPYFIRVNIVEGLYTSATLILPFYIIGNGTDTIENLIKEKNEERSKDIYFSKHLFDLNEEIENNILLLGLDKNSIIPKDEVCILNSPVTISDQTETLNITDELSEKIIQKLVEIIAVLPGISTAAIDFSTNNFIQSDLIDLKGISVSPNPRVSYLTDKGKSINMYENLTSVYIIDHKVKKELSLTSQEEAIKEQLDSYRNLKNKYTKQIMELDLSESDFSKDFLIKFKVFKVSQNLAHKKQERDYLKNNVVVNEEIFEPSNNHDKLNVTHSNVLRLLKARADSKAMAIKALDNEIVPFPGFESVVFDEHYYYTDKTKQYGASYQLYIQSLRIVAVLLLEYEKSKNLIYFYKAEELIYSWITFVSNGTDERMVWYDHPTANRTQVLIHYLYLAQNAGVDINNDLMRSVLTKHAEVLSNDDIYFNNNHGLMMDKSLMVLGHVLGEEKYFIKGYYRSIDTFWYSFSTKGTHLENSPEYHNMVVRMYEELQNYLVDNGKSYNENLLGVLSIARNYLNIIVKPDMRLPSIGDSGASPRKGKKSYANFYDFESGMAVLQYDGDKPFYMNFVCGYSSKTHKHRDDLSININYNGEDFITDPGKFNYNGKSPIRKYMTSKHSHSSFQLTKYNYHIKRSNRFNRNVALNGYNFTNELSIVKGFNKDYSNTDVVLNRAVIQLTNQPVSIIYDYIDNPSGKKLEFTQNFNLGNDIVARFEKDQYTLSGKKERLVVKQLLKSKSHELVQGDESKPVAVNTVGFSKVKESSQVKYYNTTAKKDVFLTVIYDDSVINKIKLLKLEDSIEIKIDRKTYVINV